MDRILEGPASAVHTELGVLVSSARGGASATELEMLDEGRLSSQSSPGAFRFLIRYFSIAFEQSAREMNNILNRRSHKHTKFGIIFIFRVGQARRNPAQFLKRQKNLDHFWKHEELSRGKKPQFSHTKKKIGFAKSE